jgi:hypothetical protein
MNNYPKKIKYISILWFLLGLFLLGVFFLTLYQTSSIFFEKQEHLAICMVYAFQVLIYIILLIPSVICFIIAYLTYKKKRYAWTIGMIFSVIFIFLLVIAPPMIILPIIILYLLTRNEVKTYFGKK